MWTTDEVIHDLKQSIPGMNDNMEKLARALLNNSEADEHFPSYMSPREVGQVLMRMVMDG